MATLSVHLLAGALAAVLAVSDPCLFLAPQVVLTAADRRQLAHGEIVARTLGSGAGQVAVFSISRVDVASSANYLS